VFAIFRTHLTFVKTAVSVNWLMFGLTVALRGCTNSPEPVCDGPVIPFSTILCFRRAESPVISRTCLDALCGAGTSFSRSFFQFFSQPITCSPSLRIYLPPGDSPDQEAHFYVMKMEPHYSPNTFFSQRNLCHIRYMTFVIGF